MALLLSKRRPEFQLDMSVPQGVRAIQSYRARSYKSWQISRELQTQNKLPHAPFFFTSYSNKQRRKENFKKFTSKAGMKLSKHNCHRHQLATAGRMLCVVGTGGLYFLRSFNCSRGTATFFSFKLPIAQLIFVLSWQFFRESRTRERACVLALNCSHALGDGQIQLKVRAPLS